jgi:hypothetical protein
MEISFIASLPDIQSAINISGNGATRVKIETREKEDWVVNVDDN